jgi:ferredoxin
LEADVVINLPKWKTHGLTLLTLGVKNLFGCVPGPRKALWHLQAGEDRRLFAQMLVDLYQVVRPSLTILDGILGMEGNGPNSGHPIQLGLILASRDSFSLDQIVCDLLGIPRDSLPTNRVAFEQGLARDGIEVVGERVEEVKIPLFRLPNLSQPDWNLPGFLRKALKNALTSKPIFDEGLCDNCDQCIGACPPKALERKGRALVFDYGKCIRCFCCQEVCPAGAITIEPGWALKWKAKGLRF